MGKGYLSPSLMCVDLMNAQRDIEALEAVGSDYLHIDVMDNHFVPNITLSTDFAKAVKAITRVPLDVHLMVAGEERVELASPCGLTLFEHKDDFYAYRGEAEQSLVLRPGSFLVVFPEDAHRIKIAVNGPETVSKVVFKVLIHEE